MFVINSLPFTIFSSARYGFDPEIKYKFKSKYVDIYSKHRQLHNYFSTYMAHQLYTFTKIE